MSFDIGIIGLPNAGKSTLFSLLTEAEVEIDSYPFTTIDPNIGVVKVKDDRLDKIAQAIEAEKKLYPTLKFVDIAGLIEGAHKGEGLGNKFLSHVRGCDGLVQVIKAYGDKSPEKDKETIKRELVMKDLELLQNLKKKMRGDDRLPIIEKMERQLSENFKSEDIELNEEEVEKVKEYQFLTLKPIFEIYNGKGKGFSIDLKMESEIEDLSAEERAELGIESNLDDFLVQCYNSFDLITFFTVAGKKAQGWTIRKGASIVEAAEKVHSDFKENFKRAEVTDPESLVFARSMKKAKGEGKVRITGADYEVKNGDIIEFKI